MAGKNPKLTPNTWSQVMGSPKKSKGIDLSDVEGTNVNVKTTKKDVQREIEYWRTLMICYIEKIAQVNRRVFMVRFLESEERDAVVKEGVITFDKKPIVIKQWKPDIEVMKEIVDKVPLWIKMPGLEAKYWGKVAPTKIATTTQKNKLMFARVLVEMPLNNTYLSDVMFENENGKIMKQKVEYEWKPVLCSRCRNFGHELGECRKQLEEEITKTEVNKEQQMGNQAPTNAFIKAKEVENRILQFQQQRRNTTNTRNTFARLQHDPKIENKKDDDEEEVNGTQGGTSHYL
ncbi:hypothetical protein R3W88_027312 [Solanum pinnatisectum]|uniref:DUF4283 domain-containing protein n=1 Tax=Solanum pinnatisectum TaxID=50273 RepID=A0AAV9LGE1_9SOLN|nr:hypothetical protein R3W88_027312 [Solanum pinnatisectum]